MFTFPRNHRRRIRIGKLLERLSREIKRRTRAGGIFPNAAACLRFIGAFLVEKSEDWLIGRLYLNIEGP